MTDSPRGSSSSIGSAPSSSSSPMSSPRDSSASSSSSSTGTNSSSFFFLLFFGALSSMSEASIGSPSSSSSRKLNCSKPYDRGCLPRVWRRVLAAHRLQLMCVWSAGFSERNSLALTFYHVCVCLVMTRQARWVLFSLGLAGCPQVNVCALRCYILCAKRC